MKRFSFVKPLLNQAGQGVTEYILLLVIVIALVFGGLFQLNTAFQNWANNYFGEYLACLLETGELPSIGGAPGDSGICNELFEPFDLASGRQFTGPDGSNPGGGGGGGDGDGDDGSRDGTGGGSGGRGGGVRETVPSNGSFVSSRGGSGRSGSFEGRDSAQGNAGRGRQRERYTGSTDSSLPAGAGYSQVNSRSGRPQYIAVRSNRIVDVEEREGRTQQTGGSIRRDPGSQSPDNKIRVAKTIVSKTDVLDDEPMSFGGYLRFLILAAIIIALVLLLGGQALQISKGSE